MKPTDSPIVRSLVIRALNAGKIPRVRPRDDRRVPPAPAPCDKCHNTRFKTVEKKKGIRIRVRCRVEVGGCGQERLA